MQIENSPSLKDPTTTHGLLGTQDGNTSQQRAYPLIERNTEAQRSSSSSPESVGTKPTHREEEPLRNEK